MRFDELDLEEAVLDGLDAMNFLETTPVQELTIPVILEGKDIIACAQTGTGKTAAYVLPVINELSKGLHPANAINAIIMAPTRELAQQIDQQIEGFTYFVPVSAVAVYGGTDGIAWEQQKRGMEMGADIVIATPDVCCRISNWALSICRKYPSSSWMKRTGCSIWDFMTISCRSINYCRQPARPSCSLPQCLPRSGHWPKRS